MKINRRYYGLKRNPRLRPTPGAKVVQSDSKKVAIKSWYNDETLRDIRNTTDAT